MPSVKDARDDVYDGLVGMGYSPTNLIITEFLTDSSDGMWQIKGEFKGGFMGEILLFDIKYDPNTRGFGNCKVFSSPSREGYA